MRRMIPLLLIVMFCVVGGTSTGGCNVTYKENFIDAVYINPVPTVIAEGQYEAGEANSLLDMGGMKIAIPSGGIADTAVVVQTNNDGVDQTADVQTDLDANLPGGQ